MKSMLTDITIGAKQISIRLLLYIFASCSLLVSLQLSSLFIGLIVLHALLSTSFSKAKKSFQKNRIPLFLYLGFFALFLISLTYTENLNHGWKDIESKLSFLLLPLAIFSQPKLSRLELQTILKSFAFATFMASVLAIIIGFVSQKSLLINQELSAQVGIHASYLSIYLLLSLATFIYEAIQKNKSKPLYLLLSLIGFIILLLLASRIIILSAFLIAGIYIFFFNYSRSKLLVLILSIITLGLTVYLVPSVQSRFVEAIDFSDRVELDADVNEHKTLGRNFGGRAIRVAIWTCSMDVVEENWLFGVGAGDVHQHLQQSYKDHVFEFAYKYNNYNAHNLYIETVIAVGVLGLILIMLLFAQLLKAAFNQKSLVYLTFVISFIFLSFMESSFNVHRGLVFFLLFACFFQNTSSLVETKKSES
ncbi:MAG: O-antigen ligase family protein [Vicingaceae bacterium]